MDDKYIPIQNFIKEVKVYLTNHKNVRFIEESYIETDGKYKFIDSTIIRNNETLAIFEFKAGAKLIKPQDFYEALPPLNVSLSSLFYQLGLITKFWTDIQMK